MDINVDWAAFWFGFISAALVLVVWAFVSFIRDQRARRKLKPWRF